MDINCVLETITNMTESIFDVSTETLNAATFWINYVPSRKCIPVDDMHVTIT